MVRYVGLIHFTCQIGFCQTPVLVGLGLVLDFTLAWDNSNNNKLRLKLDPQMKSNHTFSVWWVAGLLVGRLEIWRLRLISTQGVVEVDV